MTTTPALGTARRPEHQPAHGAEPTGSRLDDWWARRLRTPLRMKLWYWGAPLGVTLLAAILRLWNLGNPHSLVFDETFYVKDAYTLMHLGYEGSWPDKADQQFNAGHTDIFSSDPSFVAHPPLGKWMIAIGLAVFGAGNSFGWRISTAIVGILAVLVVFLIARKLFRSTILATVAGVLMAVDGHAIVMSRVALLDNSVMFVALLAFGCILLDRDWFATRLAAAVGRDREKGGDPAWGPVLWWRPWLIAAGVLTGLCAGVKWSGFYFLAFFAVYTVVVDAVARRRVGLPFWISGAVLKQAPATFVLMVPIALVAYVSTWAGWIFTSGGYYRNWAQATHLEWTGALNWVPLWLQNLWHYQTEMYNYSINLHVSHPYQSNPLTWLFMIRPTSMYYEGSTLGQNGCTVSACSSAITSLGNPLIWWAAAAAVFYLVYRLARYREWQVGLILTGLAAGYLPWLLYINRTIFTFYSIAFEPYLILALTFAIGLIIGRRSDARWRRVRGLWIVGIYLVFVVLVTAFFYPIWTAQTVPFWFWQIHMWLPSWV
ncbi:dolichyl-phosphate-mannose--protein mannosyltransferase [Leifsonia sp. NPDC058230]|uniref:dolichyl-phosphate-mannose--protein mannosyltransferase n=1 Tax=Leifsonia sp. NPDC058230 TaxID=3346391 RepID=UPI0036DF2FC4